MRLGDSYRLRIVSSKPVDLDKAIRDCLNFLDSLSLDSEIEIRIKKVRSSLKEPGNPLVVDERIKRNKQVLLEELFDILAAMVPEGCYFGGHLRDQTLIGFWEHSALDDARESAGYISGETQQNNKRKHSKDLSK
jgi:hypothetical protein